MAEEADGTPSMKAGLSFRGTRGIMDGGGVNPLLLKYTLIMVALVAVSKLMRDFAGELVPLILAAMFVSIIEPAVQMIEMTIVRSWELLKFFCCLKGRCHVKLTGSGRARQNTTDSFRSLSEPLRTPPQESKSAGEISAQSDSDRKWRSLGSAGIPEEVDVEVSQVFWLLWPLPRRIVRRLPREVSRNWAAEEAGQCVCARLLAVFLTLLLTVLFSAIVIGGLMEFQKKVDYDIYAQGFNDLIALIHPLLDGFYDNPVVRRFSPNIREEVQKQVEVAKSQLGRFAVELVQEAIERFGSVLAQMFFFLLYSFMWLIKPFQHEQRGMYWLGTFFTTVRSYFVLKSAINSVYCALVLILLTALNMEVAPVITLLTFFLLFIPQIGDFVPGSLPAPIILLDSRQGMYNRCWWAAFATCGMLAIKFTVSSFLEPVVMSKGPLVQRSGGLGRGDRLDVGEVHPVIIIFVVVVFGNLWGAIGMLISVPLLWLACMMPKVQEILSDGDQQPDSGQQPSA